jgi:HKD family nuclease
MIELLHSNYPPLNTGCKKFSDVFFDLFITHSETTQIASGYISEEAIADLINLYETGYNKPLFLIVGMHYFDGFTYGQYNALLRLSNILSSKNLGGVYISCVMKYHGKIYSFSINNKTSAIIGSSNLTKISSTANERVYDTDLLINEDTAANDIEKFITDLKNKFCKEINTIQAADIKIIEPSNLFDNYIDVERARAEDIIPLLTNISFDIPLKTCEKSNLNCYFGKGRKNFANGVVLPRDWYEVEIIVSAAITRHKNYPQKNKRFWVVTDDGYKFECSTSGDDSKNFRSAEDLKILGRWIKGRLENRKALNPGDKVNDATFEKYGRNFITLTKTKTNNTWYLDFGVKK